MRVPKTGFSLFLVAGFILTGCGGGSSSSSAAPVQTGYLVGGLVEALPYKCGDQKGNTGRLGQFSYKSGDSCEFSLGKNKFSVSAEKVQKGYLTAYDLTATKDEAWTLMAIMNSISFKRPQTDLFVIVDTNLEKRIPKVNLSLGDSAVASAIAPFQNTVSAVSVSAARTRLATTVTEGNQPITSLDSLISRGQKELDRLQISAVSGTPYQPSQASASTLTETNQTNVVNLVLYDGLGNPMAVNPSGWSVWTANQIWVTPGQDPKGSQPIIGTNQADMTGSNVMGMSLYVGRQTSDSVGTAFLNYAQQGSFSPTSIFASGAQPNAKENTAFPPSLNFGFLANLVGQTVSNQGSTFSCNNMMFAQGSTTATIGAILSMTYDLVKMGLNAAVMVATDGTDIDAETDFLTSTAATLKAATSLASQNWWVFAVNGLTQNARISVNGNPGVLMTCTSNGTPFAMVVTSTVDDHTFNLQITYPGQTLYNVDLQ